MNRDVCLIIATKDHSTKIDRMLCVIAELGVLGDIKVYVVDSSADSKTQEICAAYSQAMWLDARGKGKTQALNMAVLAASSDFIAFLDDDAVPIGNRWLDPLLKHFDDDNVGYVSGRVLAEEKRTAAQVAWEGKGALDKGIKFLRLGKLFFNKPQLKGLQVQLATMGANHVVRRSVFDKIGLHDERFGPGQKVPGAGADLDLTYRVLQAGYSVVYEPSSLVYHSHPEAFEELREKLYLYGIGDTAIHCKFLFEFGDWRSFFQLLYRPAQNLGRAIRNLLGLHPMPARCSLHSTMGNFAGVFFYLKYRR